ncbi:MAG: hypothetical protein MUC99_07560 [Anaerolineae bacterium]|jgi:Tol biopolymer transport system component|nr:hypothetical protein [Anaerolineae bacterium]
MSNTSIESRIQQAIAAAKQGKRDEARQILLAVVREDEDNARAWMLLARVTSDPLEKRTALMNVTQLDPNNQQANQMLAQMAISGTLGSDPKREAAQTTSFRNLVIGVVAVMLLAIVGLIALIAFRNSEQSAANATLTQLASNLTQVAALQTEAFAGTQAALDATGTAFALLPTATPTPRPTLPPEPTASPTITPIPSPTSLPLPPSLPGVMIGWGGSNALNDGYFPVVQIALDGSASITELSGTNRGELATAANRAQIFYTRYFRDTFDRYLTSIDLTTGLQENLAIRFGSNTFARATSANLTPDGRYLVFVAETGALQNQQLYLYDFSLPAGAAAVRRLTNDEFDYNFPAISPDGTKILVVRRARAPQPAETDIYLFDLSVNQLLPWTGDADATIESHPRWSPDGKLVAYVAGTQADPKGDIFLRTTGDQPSAFNVTRTEGTDEIFPVFSPDSRYLAYASDAQSEPGRTRYNIFIYDLVGGQTFQLTNDDERYYPGAWVE